MNQKLREIPFLMKTQLIFGQFLSYFGLFFFAFGFIFVLVFLTQADFQSFRFDNHPPTVKGVVTHIERTSSSENGKNIYAYYYKCSLGEGVSYESYVDIKEGAQVDIEYISSNPKIHRIKGMRTKPFGMVILFVLIFPLVGAFLAFIGIKKGLKAVHILEYGEIGYGKYLRSEPTNVRINKQPQYKMFFEFQSKDGKTHQAVATTHLTHKLTDEQFEQLFYLPDNPDKNFLIDEFSGITKFDDKGNINFEPKTKHFIPLILPTIILVELLIVMMII